jgi:hypothetical protein
MLTFLIVKTEPGANADPGLGDCCIRVEVDFLIFEATPKPLDEDVAMQRPLPSMLIMTPVSL